MTRGVSTWSTGKHRYAVCDLPGDDLPRSPFPRARSAGPRGGLLSRGILGVGREGSRRSLWPGGWRARRGHLQRAAARLAGGPKRPRNIPGKGNIIETLRRHLPLVGHVHMADVPGRHEPGTGELNFANILRALADGGYAGTVGFEFSSQGDTERALAAIAELRQETTRKGHALR